MGPIRRMTVGAVLLVAMVAAGCGSGDAASPADGATAPAPAPATGSPGTSPGGPSGTAASRPLRLLVTNDDGVEGAGLDALVQSLTALPDVEVVVVAPAEDQSGTSDSTTPGEVAVSDATTPSGYPAKAVAGYPADAVRWALDGGIDIEPDLVVSGINEGQNLGPAVEVSGTVGAARTATRAGIPALAVSQGLADDPDYPAAVGLVEQWLADQRQALLAGDVEAAVVVNLNVPTCTTGEIRGVADVPTATDVAGRNALEVDCTSTATDPADDVGAFIVGFAARSEVPLG